MRNPLEYRLRKAPAKPERPARAPTQPTTQSLHQAPPPYRQGTPTRTRAREDHTPRFHIYHPTLHLHQKTGRGGGGGNYGRRRRPGGGRGSVLSAGGWFHIGVNVLLCTLCWLWYVGIKGLMETPSIDAHSIPHVVYVMGSLRAVARARWARPASPTARPRMLMGAGRGRELCCPIWCSRVPQMVRPVWCTRRADGALL